VAILVVVVSLRVDLQDKSLGENDVVEKRIKKAFKDGLKRLLGFWLGGGVDKSENWWVLLKTLEEEEEANSINKRYTVTVSSSSSQACVVLRFAVFFPFSGAGLQLLLLT